MLEGLEAVEIFKSAVNDELRIDSQYFQKKYLLEDERRGHFENVLIGSEAYVTDGPHGYHEVDEESPIAMLTAKCARDWFAARTEADTISLTTHTTNLRSSLEAGDLILSTRGTVGLCAIIEEDLLPANIDQDVARIALRKESQLNAHYLLTYLNSRFGQDWIARNAAGMVQQGLSLAKVRQLPIPLLSNRMQTLVAEVVLNAATKLHRSATLLTYAEQTLLTELGLADWVPPNPLTYSRSSSEVLAAERFDSEHFSERHRAIEAKLVATGQAASLRSLVLVNKRGAQPAYNETGLPVINSKHVLRGAVTLDGENRFASGDAAPLKIQKGDVLLNGTGVGTIGRAAPYLHDAKAIPDNHVTILRPDTRKIDPIYLSVFLNSSVGQSQVEKWTRGSSGQIELYPSDINSFVVWIAPEEVQHAIRKRVNDAFESKRTARSLLDEAKRAVEIAIEDGEPAGLRYLGGA